MTSSIRVLAVDDSAVSREMLRHIVGAAKDIDLVMAANADLGRVRLVEHRPDVMLLDLEMPGVHGLDLLREVMAECPLPVVICSETERGSKNAKAALDLGAVDIICKPKLSGGRVTREQADTLLTAVRAAARMGTGRTRPSLVTLPRLPESTRCHDVVVGIGVSTGGPLALRRVLPRLPGSCPPVLVVQHMIEGYTAPLAQSLDDMSLIRVVEARHGMHVLPGHAYIAPAGQHMVLRQVGGERRIGLDDSPPIARHRPAVDVLFKSLARHLGPHALGVVMTGMGDDGAEGLLTMREAGALTLAQDEASCAVYGMPQAAKLRGAVRRELPLDDLPVAILHHASRMRVPRTA